MNKEMKRCKNKNCVTNHEKYVKPSFSKVDEDSKKYKCDFCSNELEDTKEEV